MAKINIVGIGPGSPDYITPISKKTVQDARVVIGTERALNLLREDIKGEVFPLTAKNIEDALKYAVKSAKMGKTVVLLSTGDPGFSGLLKPVMNKIAEDTEINVIPAVSAIQVCASRLHLCWDETSLFTFHEGANHEKMAQLALAVKERKDIILLPDPKAFQPKKIAGFLLKKGVAKETPIFICENLTLSNERIVASTLEEAAKLDFDPLCVMVVRASHKQQDSSKVKSD